MLPHLVSVCDFTHFYPLLFCYYRVNNPHVRYFESKGLFSVRESSYFCKFTVQEKLPTFGSCL